MNKRSIKIGRDVENDIVYSDQTVSRKHASITQVSDDLFVVQDLLSSNGTFVNGQ
jgi:pSer/pThr/pTyr-binding forkhead associated (FHA) protein